MSLVDWDLQAAPAEPRANLFSGLTHITCLFSAIKKEIRSQHGAGISDCHNSAGKGAALLPPRCVIGSPHHTALT